jgi:putative hemolysin
MPDSFYAALAALPLSIVFGGARQALKVQEVSNTTSTSSYIFLRSITEISLLLLILILPFAAVLILPVSTPSDLLFTLGCGLLATLIGVSLGSAWARGRGYHIFLVTAQVLGWVLIPLLPLSVLIHLLCWRRRLLPDEEDEYLEDLEEDVEKLEPEGREMVAGVVEFAGLTVREVMVPRIEVTGVDITATLVEASKVIDESGHSRLPVYNGSIDNILGIVHAKDLIPLLADKIDKGLRDILRKAYFVPEATRVAELLKEFQRSKTQIAIVVDEYGGTAGIVTLEDLLEEIVGEIHDEYDTEEKVLMQVSPGVWRAQGKLDLRELEDLFDFQLDDEDYETLGGYILAQLGRMPKPGDVVENDWMTITVDEVDERRIIWVTLHIKEQQEKEKDKDRDKEDD